MPCTYCGNEKVLARGLCQPCYHRLRRNGTVARKYMRNDGGPCSIEGCTEQAISKRLCTLHYHRSRHPMTNTWKLVRSRYPGEFPPAWKEFERFLADIGERPSKKHQIRRINEDEPWSAKNFRWVAPTLNGKNQWMSPEDRAIYMREWTLRKRFGIGLAEYNRMLAEQGGTCAICRCEECFVNSQTEAPQSLGVDHDHGTGKVRGLLCVRCNRMLGYGRDDPEILRRATAYLERHREKAA